MIIFTIHCTSRSHNSFISTTKICRLLTFSLANVKHNNTLTYRNNELCTNNNDFLRKLAVLHNFPLMKCVKFFINKNRYDSHKVL